MRDAILLRRRWPLIGGGLLVLAVLAALVWSARTAAAMKTVETDAYCALADLNRMQHASRSLLSSRSDFRRLAEDWSAAVDAFALSFRALGASAALTGADERGLIPQLDQDWDRINAQSAPARAAIQAICAAPLAARLGDHGLEGTLDRLLNQADGAEDLARLRRLQRHLAAFDLAAEDFADRLATHAHHLRAAAGQAGRHALAIAVCLGVALLVVGGWLLVRISLLNLRLRDEVAARCASQAAMQERERGQRAILASLDEGVVVVDAEGRVTWFNAAAAALTGLDPATVLGTPWAGLLPVREAQGGQAIDLGLATQPCRHHDLLLARRGSEDLRLAISLCPMRAEDGHSIGMVAVLIDLSERSRLEQRLSRAQTLESIGQLAGGIAHDFNNMLAGILGSAELLATRIGERPDQRRLVDVIITAAGRAATLTRQLLDFARRSAMQRTRVDLHLLVEESLHLLGRSFDRRITLATDLGAGEHWVEGDSAQLQNVIVNLAVNARDAMPEGGELRFSTRNGHCAGEDGQGHGQCLELTVSDTGTGIPAEVLPRIFEPFFTTKAVGRGSGLGLAAVQGTVARHGGRVTVDSQPGSGTRFTVHLPVVQAPVVEPAAVPTGGGAGGTRQQRVLVVDDEAVVRQTVAMALGHLGYQVVLAGDGCEALELFRREHAQIDLVLLDLVMPRMSGRDTFLALRAIAPQVKVL
ncbi:MAG: ATP-binding protein, partial [Planctomycetes bacterium]|nr:ATP-binding protein [Planctomycetota bacterium]